MSVHDWHLPHARSVGLYLDGAIVHTAGGTVADDDFLLVFNGGHEPCRFTIPAAGEGRPWSVALEAGAGVDALGIEGAIDVEGFGFVILRRPRS
jgi:glycogen operon protein